MTDEKFIHDIVAELLGLPKNRVIKAYSNGPAPKDNHATIRYYGLKQEVPAEYRLLNSNGDMDIRTTWNCVCEIQYYATKGDAVQELRRLSNQLEKYSIQQRFSAQRLALFSYEQIQDLTALVSDTWQSRAALDIHIRFTDSTPDRIDMIEKIQVTGDAKEAIDTGVIEREVTNGEH